MRIRQAVYVAALLGWMASLGFAATPAKLALQGGRIISVTGPDIEQGTLLMEHGKITAIGKDVKIPYDAMVVDVAGKVLFPGIFSPHTSQGLDRANENLSVAPFLDVYDAIDPSKMSFEDALRDGVLAVHMIQGNSCVIGGLSRLVHPIGLTPDEMTIQGSIALKMCTSPKPQSDRMSQMASMRGAFVDLDQYLGNLAEKRYEDELKKEKKKIEVSPDQARKLGRKLIRDQDCDDKHRNLFKLTQGRLAAWIYCGAATDVAPAIAIAKANGFLDKTVFVLGTDAYRAVKELKAVKRPVVLSETLMDQRRDPITGELQETFAPKVIHDAGLVFALQPNRTASLGERYLGYQAARCVRHGIPRRKALAAITINPARMLGVGDRLGSLEVGKDAYVVVLSGDPLDFNSWVEKAYVRGVLAYDRTEDVRLKKLLGLEKRFQDLAKKKADAAKKKAAKKKPATAKTASPKPAAKKPATKKPETQKPAAKKEAVKEKAARDAAPRREPAGKEAKR